MSKERPSDPDKMSLAFKWLMSFLAVSILVAAVWGLGIMHSTCEPESLRWVCRLFGVEEKAAVVERVLELAFGGILIAGLVVAYQRSKALTDTAKASLQAVQATTAGQQQERFREAANHLGHENASVRQEGAHSLFHLALEEDKFRVSIANILCAHIRETTQRKAYRKKCPIRPSTEIQSLLELLFAGDKQDEENSQLDSFWEGIRPNLTGCYFNGIELERARFRKADLRYAQFQDVLLGEAQFQGALLYSAQFQLAWLGEAQFQGARLDGSQFQGAWIRKAQFQGARLGEAQFQGSRLDEAQFQGAQLDEAQFQGARLYKAQFQGAKLYKAQFQGGFSKKAQDELLDYKTQMRNQSGCESDLDSVIFSGGLDDTQAKEIVTDLKEVLESPERGWRSRLSKIDIESFEKEIRENHVGKPESNTPPYDADTGTYSEKEAEQWINEHQAALAEGNPNSGAIY